MAKFKIESQALIEELAKHNQISKREQKTQVVIDATRMTLSTNNLAQELVSFVEIKEFKGDPITTMIDLSKISPKMLEGPVTSITLTEEKIAINSGSSKMNHKTVQGAYLSLSLDAAALPVHVPTKAFFTNLKAMASFVKHDKVDILVTNCVHLEAHGKMLSMAATDGYSASWSEIELESESETPLILNIPGRMIADIRVAFKGSAEMSLRAADDGSVFEISEGNTRFIARTLSGKYPNLLKILPPLADTDSNIKINRDSLKMKLEPFIQFSQVQPVELSNDDRLLQLKCEHDGSSYERTVDLEEVDRPFVIQLNAPRLGLVLKELVGEVLEMRVVGPRKPVVISDPETSINFMIMPVNPDAIR